MMMKIAILMMMIGVLLPHPERDWSCICLSLGATCQGLKKKKVHITYSRTEPHHDDHQTEHVDFFHQTGELLYSGEERAPPLLVLLPPEVMMILMAVMIMVMMMMPKVLPEVATSLVWRPGLTISAPIRARPKPQVLSSSSSSAPPSSSSS